MSNAPFPPAARSARRALAAILMALAAAWIAAGCASPPAPENSLEASSDIEAAAASEATDAGPQSPDVDADDELLPGPVAESEPPRQESAATPNSSPSGDRISGSETTPTPTPEPTPLYDFSGTDLAPAPTGVESLVESAAAVPTPVSLAIEGIDVVDATVIPVGVNPDQTFEVPPADQVGWYRFGPTPGDEGSAVLAAHIAFDGVDGVFRHLADVAVGDIVTVGFDDGTSQSYEITSVTEYLKQELPAELFARTGPSQLALITCGGTFNRQLSAYDSNVVAVAVPV